MTKYLVMLVEHQHFGPQPAVPVTQSTILYAASIWAAAKAASALTSRPTVSGPSYGLGWVVQSITRLS